MFSELVVSNFFFSNLNVVVRKSMECCHVKISILTKNHNSGSPSFELCVRLHPSADPGEANKIHASQMGNQMPHVVCVALLAARGCIFAVCALSGGPYRCWHKAY